MDAWTTLYLFVFVFAGCAFALWYKSRPLVCLRDQFNHVKLRPMRLELERIRVWDKSIPIGKPKWTFETKDIVFDHFDSLFFSVPYVTIDVNQLKPIQYKKTETETQGNVIKFPYSEPFFMQPEILEKEITNHNIDQLLSPDRLNINLFIVLICFAVILLIVLAYFGFIAPNQVPKDFAYYAIEQGKANATQVFTGV